MSVLLPDGIYELRRKTVAKDASMFPVPSYPENPDWTGEGYSDQKPDRSYAIALDAAALPVSYDDEITLPDGTLVLVRTANETPNPVEGAPAGGDVWAAVRAVDVTAVLRSLAQLPREEQGGQPG